MLNCQRLHQEAVWQAHFRSESYYSLPRACFSWPANSGVIHQLLGVGMPNKNPQTRKQIGQPHCDGSGICLSQQLAIKVGQKPQDNTCNYQLVNTLYRKVFPLGISMQITFIRNTYPPIRSRSRSKWQMPARQAASQAGALPCAPFCL